MTPSPDFSEKNDNAPEHPETTKAASDLDDHYLELARRQMADHLEAVERMSQKSAEKSAVDLPEIEKKRPFFGILLLSLLIFLILYYVLMVHYYERTRQPTESMQLNRSHEARLEQVPSELLAEQRDPAQAAFAFNQGMVFLRAQDYSDAIRMLERAKNYDPKFIGAYINVAFAYLQIDDDARALENLELAQQMNPNHPRVLFLLGTTHGLRGEIEAARLYLNRVQALSPESPFAARADSLLALIRETEAAMKSRTKEH